MTNQQHDDDETAIIKCNTTKGSFVMKLQRFQSPKGYDKAVQLFEKGYYDHSHFFRVLPGFLVQFGISYTKDKQLLELAHKRILDDPQMDPPIPFTSGTIAFAGSGTDSRTCQLFISYGKDTRGLGTRPWETPLGHVVDGFDTTLLHLYSEYRDHGPEQGKLWNLGKDYVHQEFASLDSFMSCHVKRTDRKDVVDWKMFLMENEGESMRDHHGNEKMMKDDKMIMMKDEPDGMGLFSMSLLSMFIVIMFLLYKLRGGSYRGMMMMFGFNKHRRS